MASCEHCGCDITEYKQGKWIHSSPEHFESGCCYVPKPKAQETVKN